jgi:hypothetical protein
MYHHLDSSFASLISFKDCTFLAMLDLPVDTGNELVLIDSDAFKNTLITDVNKVKWNGVLCCNVTTDAFSAFVFTCPNAAVECPVGSRMPTTAPSQAPTQVPTAAPTSAPATQPSAVPTSSPTMAPTPAPSAAPKATKTASPTAQPSAQPTSSPTIVLGSIVRAMDSVQLDEDAAAPTTLLTVITEKAGDALAEGEIATVQCTVQDSSVAHLLFKGKLASLLYLILSSIRITYYSHTV